MGRGVGGAYVVEAEHPLDLELWDATAEGEFVVAVMLAAAGTWRVHLVGVTIHEHEVDGRAVSDIGIGPEREVWFHEGHPDRNLDWPMKVMRGAFPPEARRLV